MKLLGLAKGFEEATTGSSSNKLSKTEKFFGPFATSSGTPVVVVVVVVFIEEDIIVLLLLLLLLLLLFLIKLFY